MTTNDYKPIACDQHAVLELLAMRRTPVELRARAESREGEVFICGEVLDVLTRAGAEYLVLHRPGGNPVSVRLDRLLSLSAPDGGVLWRQKSAADWRGL